MFGGLGKLAQLLANPQGLRDQAERMRTRLAELRVEGSSPQGEVRVVVSGDHRVISVQISPELQETEITLIEEHVQVAFSQAFERARAATARELSELSNSLGLPGFEQFLKM
jgi:DNA-binding protein YbaB